MKSKLLQLALVFTLLCAVVAVPIRTLAADDTSEEASNSATTSELKKRIEKVVDEKREQIKGVLQDLLANKKGFIGEITRISEEAITVKSADNTTIIPIAESLNIMQDGKDLEVSAIEVGNWVTVLGNKDGEGIEAEYLMVSDDSLSPKPQLVNLGSITEITRTSITITTRGTQEDRELNIVKGTEFQDVDGEEATVAEFEEDLNVLVVAVQGDKEGWDLLTVRSLAPFEQ